MTWASEIRAIHDEAGGLLDLHVVRMVDLPDLLDRVAVGDVEAGQIIAATSRALTRITSAPRSRPMLCAACPRPLRRKSEFGILIAAPHRPDADRCLGLAICARCGTTSDEIRAKGVEALRRIWPNARSIVLPTPHEAGRA